jgi:hypothetical protein
MVDTPRPIHAHSSTVSRFLTRRFVAALALVAFVLPVLPLTLVADHTGDMAMACCVADHCRTPALSAPCCSHSTTSHATPSVPGTLTTARDTTAQAVWAALVFDQPTLARPWRARALAASIRGRRPDPPHLLNSVFLI